MDDLEDVGAARRGAEWQRSRDVAELERLTAQLQAAQARADEAETQLAFIAAGCVSATREELVKRITAVGPERYKAGNWLAEHDKHAAAKALKDAADVAQQAFVDEQQGIGFARVRTDWLRARAASIEQAEAGRG